ncbi:MAG: threonine--tRNA ligase, partial [Candidatus Omnitrophica bacterium]|nr:threonine--tRNA ligase [Candidatus Omnitrophota bacterium]
MNKNKNKNNNQNRDLEALRHSASHVLAQAVTQLYPGVKLGIGPAIADGFYYDFDCEAGFSPEDLVKIEKKMAEIIKQDLPIEQKNISKSEAEELFGKKDQPYKLELIQQLGDEHDTLEQCCFTVSLFSQGDFIDLCKGPHVASTGKVKAFKLTSLAGAYWRGSERNPMLQRI